MLMKTEKNNVVANRRKKAVLTAIVGIASVFILIIVGSNLLLGIQFVLPGQSVNLTVNTPKELEASSQLTLTKFDDSKLELSGQNYWGDKDAHKAYDIKNQKVTDVSNILESEPEIPNTQSGDTYMTKDGIVAQYKGEKIFNVTNNEKNKYNIKIKNISDKIAIIRAQIIDKGGLTSSQ